MNYLVAKCATSVVSTLILRYRVDTTLVYQPPPPPPPPPPPEEPPPPEPEDEPGGDEAEEIADEKLLLKSLPRWLRALSLFWLPLYHAG